MQVTGQIIAIEETKSISETFKKREFVIEYCEREYPEYIKFEFTQDRCELLDNHKVGDNVEVAFNLKGRKWVNPEGETLYFNTLQAWRIQPPAQMSANQYQQATGQPAMYQQAPPAPYQQPQQAPPAPYQQPVATQQTVAPMPYQQPVQNAPVSQPIQSAPSFPPPMPNLTDDGEVPF